VSQTRVLIVQAVAKHYRKPLFDRLHERLAERGIDLSVAYSAPNRAEALKRDNIDLPAAYGRLLPARWLLGNRLVYQPILGEVGRARLVILEHASKHVMSYVVLGLRRLGAKKVAFWGHGRNMQARPSALAERLKRALVGQVDWWFAYTQSAAAHVAAQSFDPRHITTVGNSIDTSEFRALLASVTAEEIRSQRGRLGLTPESRVALFCGSLYEERDLPLLIHAADRVRRDIENFHLVVVGDGPQKTVIEHAAMTRDWLHVMGPLFGRDKATLFRVAELYANPGLVGLGILDAFTASLPVLASDCPNSPEFEYVEAGRNGWIAPHVADRYAESVIKALQDRELLARLRVGAAASAEKYGIETMADRFRDGILACLGQ
jgi:glycosyltransferase involved in cell wall biosynthesis